MLVRMGATTRRTGWVWSERFAWRPPQQGAMHAAAGGWIEGGLPLSDGPVALQRFRNLAAVSGLLDVVTPITPRMAAEEELTRFHTPDYVRHVRDVARDGGGEVGDGAFVGPEGYDTAALAAGAALVAVEAVVAGSVDNAFALVAPPGRHAEADQGLRLCVFANAALAALHARHRLGLTRVAIVDWAPEHANGTEDAFYDDPAVLTISVHADGAFPPGRGQRAHRGEEPAVGGNVNVPLPDGSGTAAYLAAIDRVVVPTLRRFGPQLTIIAAGFGANAFDGLGRQLLHSEAFREMTGRIRRAVESVGCLGPVCIHEGGASDAYVPFCGVAVLEELCGTRAVVDPFLPELAARPGQALTARQGAVIRAAEMLVPRDRRNPAALATPAACRRRSVPMRHGGRRRDDRVS
jgi:acetoin utilization deacetylase AcuC-like enzyme